MALDCNVQTRLDKCTLATIARYAYAHGNFRALKSASALVRWIVEDYYAIICNVENTEPIVYSDEAESLLTELGVFPRTAERGYMRNLQEQNNATNTNPPHWRDARPASHTKQQVQRKLPIDAGDEASVRQEIAQAIQSAQLKTAMANRANDNSAYEAALASKLDAKETNTNQETTSEPDEGEFSAEVVREQLKE